MPRVHHLNCVTIHTNLPYPGVTHCLLIECDAGLVLVDAGFGVRDYAAPSRHVRRFMVVNGIPLDPEETALRQVAGLGYAPEDVKHIVLTHMHLDHAGGISDFPLAQVHVYDLEYETAQRPRRLSLFDRVGYVTEHVSYTADWVRHSLEGQEWFGLPCATVLQEADLEVLLVPLVGHSRGHCGVALQVEESWLLHCGDAYVRDMQVDPDTPRSPFPFFVRPMERSLFPSETLEGLRGLRREHLEIRMFCSHDPIAFAEFKGISVEDLVADITRRSKL